MIDKQAREKTLVDLWRKLTGDEGTPASEILMEAAAAHRKQANVRTASPSFRRWLASPPARFGSNAFGSSVERVHPVDHASINSSTLASPGVGSYDPQIIESGKHKGSSWRSTSTVSRLKKATEESSEEGHRDLPWEAKDLAPGAQAYRTSCRDMGKMAAAKQRSPSPGMARPSSPSRVATVKHAMQERKPGPGSYDNAQFNLSRKDHTRPSSNFRSATPRESPFGAKTPMAGTTPSKSPRGCGGAGGGGMRSSPMVAGGLAALEASLPWSSLRAAQEAAEQEQPRSPNKCGREL